MLDTPKDKRGTHLDELLANLDYVNGSLFSGRLAFAEMTSPMRAALLACTEFDWSRISPAIFGSLFQGVMDGKERRAIGAHYTGERDILKVINPLFLDALRAELSAILTGPERGREAKLEAFHNKLAGLQFLDPACGCGNFLIITYRELRKLEIQVLRALHGGGQRVIDVSLLTKVRVEQFHGIEIEEFPATIARVAMWLMDHIENLELGHSFGQSFTRLPLTGSAHIVHGNALQLDWKEVLSPEKCSYILGNRPFVGKQYMSPAQKEDLNRAWKNAPGTGVLDFVTGWWITAAEYMRGVNRIRCAFVSTNSICQGEQAGLLWGRILAPFGYKIHFAHRTFTWQSEARGKAHVHCVIVGFGHPEAWGNAPKRIFDYDGDANEATVSSVTNISPYLVQGPDSVVISRGEPLCSAPPIAFGSMPNDGGNLLLSPAEKEALLEAEPDAAPFIRPFLGSEEFINGLERWCLWLKDASPIQLRNLPLVLKRVEAVRAARAGSSREATRKLAAYPSLFGEDRQPNTCYLGIPKTSSERRPFLPVATLSPEIIASTELFTIAGANLYNLGIISSTMHMAWLRQVGGRLKSDYRYSAKLVYNNFPWPMEATEEQKSKVEQMAQGVLDARALFPGSTLADLYDPLAMPPALAKAHEALDRAVERCYRKEPFESDRQRVEYLFALYERLTAPLAVEGKKKRKAKRFEP